MYMFSRRIRILLLGAVVTLGLLGVILIEAPEPTRTVDEVMETLHHTSTVRLQFVVKLSMEVSMRMKVYSCFMVPHLHYKLITSMHRYPMV